MVSHVYHRCALEHRPLPQEIKPTLNLYVCLRGWRSWNCFYADINDKKIRAQIDALVKPRDSDGRSLHSLGFASIGIDEGWEGCRLGVNKTVHYANGTPAVDPARFPDMPGLVRHGHSRGVKMGFYLNGCGCNEKRELRINYGA